MRIKTTSINLLAKWACWVATFLLLADHLYPVFTVVAESTRPMPTITPTPAHPQSIGFTEYFRLNVLSLAAFITSLGVILAAIGKIFKPVRKWFVNWVRRALDIEDINKINEERMSALETKIDNESDERKKEYLAMKTQNDSISGSLACLLASTNEINRKMTMAEDSSKSLLLDAITKTYNKYCKRKAIPIHEKKSMSDLYDSYKAYTDDTYAAWMIENSSDWHILSGDDMPPNDTRH